MQEPTVARPLVTYILLVADFYTEGVERDAPVARDSSADAPSPWSASSPARSASARRRGA